MLAPAALALLMTTFAEGRERNAALGIYGAAAGSGAAVGVLLGGVLTSYLSWALDLLHQRAGRARPAIALTPLLLRESRAENALRHFDVAGATSITAGLMLLVYALTRATTARLGQRDDNRTTRSRISGARALAFHRHRAALQGSASAAPDLPHSLSLAAANVAMVIIGSATFAEFFRSTLYLEDVLHYTAVQTGVAFSGFAISVPLVAVEPGAGRREPPVRPDPGHAHRRHRGIGALGGLALPARLPIEGHYFWDMFPAFVLARGLGLGFSFVPLTIASLAGVGAI